MRLFIAALFILLSGCSFMANAGNGENVEKVSKEDYNEYHANIETKIEVFDDLSIVMHYPETPNDQIDQTVLDYVNEKRSDFKKESYKRVQEKGVSSVQELHIDYEIIHEDPDTYVVKFEETTTWGEDREKVEETIFHFGKSHGKRLSLTHFLEGEEEQNELYTYVEQKVNQKVTGQDLDNFIYEGATLTLFIGEQSVQVDKEEHVAWFREKFRKQVAGSSEGPDNLGQREKPDEIPVTKAMAAEYPVVVMGGPHPERTEELLSILEENGEKAMFYLVGTRAEHYPEEVRAIEEAGHMIVAHTWNYRIPERLSKKEKQEHRDRSVNVIGSITDQEEVFVSTGEINPGQELINRANWKNEPKAWVMEQMWKSVQSRGLLVISDLDENSPMVLQKLLPHMDGASEPEIISD